MINLLTVISIAAFFMPPAAQADTASGVAFKQSYGTPNEQKARECSYFTGQVVLDYLKGFNSCHQDDDCMRIATLGDSVFVHRYHYDAAMKVAEVYDLLFNSGDIRIPAESNGPGFGRCVDKVCVIKQVGK